MRFIIFVLFFLSVCNFAVGQVAAEPTWYSQTNNKGIIIQNSFPRGGFYKGPANKVTTKKRFNYSRLVFFTRVVNETGAVLKLTINFSADSIPIPHSPDTFVKVFLPSDTMTLAKQSVFDFGVGELKSFDKPTMFQRTIKPDEDCLFYVVAIFYQTVATRENRNRGGNRAELIMKGQNLFYRIPTTIDSLPCGEIIFEK